MSVCAPRPRAWVLALALACLPAAASQPVPSEQAWTRWQRAAETLWRQWRAQALTAPHRQALLEDATALPRSLVEAGVLPADNPHAWTSGCSPFAAELRAVAARAQTPQGLEDWRQWRAVYRVMCGPLAGERAAVTAAVERAQAWALPAPAAGAPSWSTLLLDELPESAWECMAHQVPVALRTGLDRHEGLHAIASACHLDGEIVFGQAASCDTCLAHPRVPVEPGLYQTWAALP